MYNECECKCFFIRVLTQSSRLAGSISDAHSSTKLEQDTRISQHEYSNITRDSTETLNPRCEFRS